jgi:hypothetical protein
LRWASAPPQPAAFQKYRAAREARVLRASALDQALHNEPFPAVSDVFDLSAQGGDLTITERSSGAQWRISIPAAGAAPE